MRTALLFLLLLAQDESSALLERLRSDDVRERDAASRQLETLGLAEIERLQARAGNDPEVRARLREVAATLRKRAEMAKIFGPTKRVTASYKQRKLGDVAAELKKALDEPLELVKVDPDRRIDLELRNATLWETLDALGRAAGVRIDYGLDAVDLLPGPRAELPSKTVEQFRIFIREIKRMEYREPGRADEIGLVTILAAYQRNMKPVDNWTQDSLIIDSVQNAAGDNLKLDRVDWSKGRRIGMHPFSMLASVEVRSDKGPLTIEGRTYLRFEVKRLPVSIPMAEGQRKARVGETVLEVAEVAQTPTGLSLELRLEAAEGNPRDALKEDTMVLVDGAGKRHAGFSRGGSSGGTYHTRRMEFPAGIEKPERLDFDWITDFHLVEIPFRFEGVQIP